MNLIKMNEKKIIDIAKQLLQTSLTTGNGSYVSEYGPMLYGNLIEIVTNGDEEYCKKHRHLRHHSLDYCPICGQRTNAKGLKG